MFGSLVFLQSQSRINLQNGVGWSLEFGSRLMICAGVVLDIQTGMVCSYSCQEGGPDPDPNQ